MLASVLYHAVLGVLLALLVWAAGSGVFPRRPQLGYAFGLALVTVAAVLVLVTPWLAIIAVPLVVAPLFRARLRGALAPLIWSLPGAIGLGTALGYLLHAPSATRNSNAYGDFVYYAEKALAARASLFPLHDYLVEGQRGTYVEGAPTFIGGALTHLPKFDPFLFGAASLPAFLVAALAIGFGVTLRRDGGGRWLLALLAVVCVAYPTWLTESAPVALAVPLAFPLYALWRDGTSRRGWIVLLPLLALEFVFTKGFGLITLAVVAAFALVRRYGMRLRAALPWILAAVVAAGAALAVFLFTASWLTHVLSGKFLPANAVRGLHRELTVRNTQSLTPALLVVGESLLFAALAWARAWMPAAAVGAAIAGTWFVGGHGLDVTVGLAVVVTVLYAADAPARVRRELPLLAAAAAVLALSAWFRDISGVHTAFLFVALLFLGLLAALVRRAAPLVAVAALVLAIAAPFSLHRGVTTLYSEDYDVWHRVAQDVPRDGLVFTSETGPIITGDEGWNYYPGVARRQVYLAGWSNSSLLVRRDELARRLALNRGVLDGVLDPAKLRLSRRYDGYYAVIRRGERVPKDFRPLYVNDRLALYRIES